MAKKKVKPNYTGWIIAAIIVLVIIILVMQKPAQEKAVTKPSEITEPGKVSKVVAAPEMVPKCDLNYVIGVANRCTLVDGNAKMPVVNSGKGTIPGMWFKVTAVDGKEAYFKSSESISVKETKAYTLELSSWSAEIGSAIKSVTLYPMTSDGKACENQRIIQQIDRCE